MHNAQRTLVHCQTDRRPVAESVKKREKKYHQFVPMSSPLAPPPPSLIVAAHCLSDSWARWHPVARRPESPAAVSDVPE